MSTNPHDDGDDRLAGDAQRSRNRAGRRAEASDKRSKHGTAAQVSPFGTTVASASGNQRQEAATAPPSRHGDRGDADADAEAGPPLSADRLAGDLLVGADAIRDYLVYLGMPEGTDPYYLKRAGRWPIGKSSGDGGLLVASKRRLSRHAAKITQPTS